MIHRIVLQRVVRHEHRRLDRLDDAHRLRIDLDELVKIGDVLIDDVGDGIDDEILFIVAGQHNGSDTLHRTRIDDEDARAAVFVRVDTVIERIVGNRVDRSRYVDVGCRLARNRIDLADGALRSVSGVNVSGRRIRCRTVHRADADLAYYFTSIRIGDE